MLANRRRSASIHRGALAGSAEVAAAVPKTTSCGVISVSVCAPDVSDIEAGEVFDVSTARSMTSAASAEDGPDAEAEADAEADAGAIGVADISLFLLAMRPV